MNGIYGSPGACPQENFLVLEALKKYLLFQYTCMYIRDYGPKYHPKTSLPKMLQ